MVFVTGDVSQDESPESYKLALIQLERLNAPVHWIHGNHDDETNIKSVFDMSSNVKHLDKLTSKFWNFISVNTCRHGTDNGHIENNEFENFKDKITSSKRNGKNIAVLMHHHPVPVNTPLIDDCMLQNNQRFLDVIHANGIKLVICGHVHGDYKIQVGRSFIETCPATCFQWKRGTSKIETELKSGFKLFGFNTDSHASTTIFI